MKKLIMLDQDGTICNRQYQVTADITALLQELIQAGVVIVPNSDTPIARLKYNFQKMLGFAPEVIVGEKGAVVVIEDKTIFPRNILGIQDFIFQLKEAFTARDAVPMVGDSATWIREKKHFEPNRKMIIIDGLRQQTIGFYFMVTDSSGLPQINDVWSKECLDIVSKIPVPEGLNPIDYNHSYGFATLNVQGVSKTDGYHKLKAVFPDYKFFMIGDGDIDIIADEAVIHCAVANASEALKKHSGFVSQRTYTEGVAECLLWISSL